MNPRFEATMLLYALVFQADYGHSFRVFVTDSVAITRQHSVTGNCHARAP